MTARARLRRYPALGFLAVAALLASLLPSALRVPLSGPTASAELAPVPGKSDNAQGDLSALGQTTTGGLGAGSGVGGVGPGDSGGSGMPDLRAGELPSPPPSGTGRNPATKRCVGRPARQTEDPLSPPCVAHFDGDNGGATAKGVTRDEVRVVIWAACTTNNPTLTEVSDGTYAAYARYFNDRFQTYGRRVRLWVWTPRCQPASSMVAELDEKVDPFAIIGWSNSPIWTHAHSVEAARRGIVTTFHWGSRQLMRDNAPYLFAFRPDLEDTTAAVVEFVCARLAGRPARFAPDPSLQRATRKFELLYSDPRDPANLLVDLVRNGIRDRCGAQAGEVRHEPSSSTEERARMRTAGVTTVIYIGADLSVVTNSTAGGWHPEWLVPEFFNQAGKNFIGRIALGTAGAIGLTPARRVDDFGRQPYTTAAQEGCGCATDRATEGYEFAYEQFLLLFTGIQAAGPKLTAANMDRGLHAITPHRSPDPRVPAAYFAPGNYSFVKDHAALRWDPAGTRTGNQAPGCWLLVEGGKRYRAEDWASSPGDDVLTAEGQPCQAD